MCNGVFYRWGFYAPDGPALDEVSQLVDAGKVLLLHSLVCNILQ
jgi:hypothetical protein